MAGASSLVIVLALDGMRHGAVAQEFMSGTASISNQTISSSQTTGGAGSGGGAGLGGAMFVGDGATVNLDNVDFLGNTAMGGQGGAGKTGGAMNSRSGGTPPAASNDGQDGSSGGAFVNSGDGVGGSGGEAGQDGTNSAGGAGGDGGSGSNGSLSTADLVKAIADQVTAAYEAVSEPTVAGLYTALATAFTTASGAAAVGGVNVGGPAPNPALATALATVAGTMTTKAGEAGTSSGVAAVQLAAEAAYITALQVTTYATGASGLGGDAGDGGAGGAGAFGFGGGAGGAGGNGGAAVGASAALGGDGGNGGDGGRGGFGGGGGMGGNRGLDGDSGRDVPPSDIGSFWGAGGAAGFGGGVGSTADGSANGTGGGGGSGFGGAVFVADGGTLNITGNATFAGNSVFGGSSANGGEAGQAAGSDLFMMTGSTVNLDPGEGNTITFNGSIADDSRASIAGTGIASGSGAGITVKSGRVIFNGTNTYTGGTTIAGGVLQADDGTGIHNGSNINFAGGVLQTSGTFDRFLGTAPDRVQWTGSGGFAAIGGDLTVRLNSGAGLTWGQGSFVTDGASLLFGSDSADSDVTFVNGIDLAGGTRTIVNNGGADGGNRAILAGVLSNGGLVLGDGTTEGTIVLTGRNTHQGSTTVNSGTNLVLSGGGSIGSSSEVAVDGSLDISETDDGASLVSLSGDGSVELGIKDLTISNGSTGFSGIVSGTGGLSVNGGTQTLSGVNTFSGATAIAGGAELALKGNGEISASAGVMADGLFNIARIGQDAQISAFAGSGTLRLGNRRLTVTNASTTFSGTIEGSGGFAVSGGRQTLENVQSSSRLIAVDGGRIAVNGGSVTAGAGDAALSVENGGTIETIGTRLQSDTAMVSASFNKGGRVANVTLGNGTVLDQGDATLLQVARTGEGSDAIVNLRIDNGAEVSGDVIDRDAKTGNGATTVTIADGASWSGLADAAGFTIEAGASAVFEDGSRIDGGLTVEAGGSADGQNLAVTGDAVIDDSALTGNVFIVGDLDLNGLLSPGQSPGRIAIGGNLTSSTASSSKFEVTFGLTDPQAGVDYDQLSVGGDANEQLVIDLQRLNPNRGTELGNIGAMELIRIGGNNATAFRLADRFTQNGHEVMLEKRMRGADSAAMVLPIPPGGGPQDETTFFGPGDLTVYGLTAFVQDETFGLTALAGTAGYSVRSTLGTAIERRGALDPADRRTSWLRAGATASDIDDHVDQTQTLVFTEVGTDLFEIGGLRLGLIGSHASSNGEVTTNTGLNDLSGTLYSAGLQANWSDLNGNYVDAVGLYSFSDWTFTPTRGGALTADAETFTAVLEAGRQFGSDAASITPWVQFTYQTTSITNVKSEWLDAFQLIDAESSVLRAGLRAEGRVNGIAPYADVALSHDLGGENVIMVDGFEFASGMGGTRAELGLGVAVNINDSINFSSAYRSAFAIESGSSSAHQGQVRLQVTW